MERWKITNACSKPPKAVEAERASEDAAGLFDLELPCDPGFVSAPPRVSLEKAIELCRQYRRLFGLVGRPGSEADEPRCMEEFVL